ncbi:MAG TPA: Sec-independent protein translocase protein TatB [Caulobacteraceae bacterium]|jgi:sec-independent protein translocase protein TatB
MFPEGRLFDFLIVGVVALIVVGPKDLPLLMRKVGQFMARVRGMAAEFRASFDELARQSELDELRREVQALRGARPIDFAAKSVGAEGLLSDIRGDIAQTNADLAVQNAALASAGQPPLPEPAPPPEATTEAEVTPPKPKRVRKPKAAAPATPDTPTP